MWTSQNRMSVGKNVAKLPSFFLLTIQHHFTIQISATSLVTLSIDGKYFAFYFNAFFLTIADKAIFNFNFFSPHHLISFVRDKRKTQTYSTEHSPAKSV